MSKVSKAIAVNSDPPVERATYQIRALERGLDILEAFSVNTPELTIREIAERSDLPKPTVIRLLSVLADRGYVERLEGSEGFRLGVRTVEVSSVYLQATSVETKARPIMTRLAQATGQTANFGIMDNFQVVHVEVVAPDRPVRLWASIGKREDAHVSGLGKVLLAALAEEDLERYLKLPRAPYTQFTITDADALRQELLLTAERGWAIDRQESNLGVVCVAAPVRNVTGKVVAAISITGLLAELEADGRIENLATQVRAAATDISGRLGWKPSS
jgi:DNA-binding IclR family transcriptional regulator